MRCKKCGNLLNEGSQFCSNCGTALGLESNEITDQVGNFAHTEKMDTLASQNALKSKKIVALIVAVCVVVSVSVIAVVINKQKTQTNELLGEDNYSYEEDLDDENDLSNNEESNEIDEASDDNKDYSESDSAYLSESVTAVTNTTASTKMTTQKTTQKTTQRIEEKIKQLLKNNYWYSEGEGIVVFRLGDDDKLYEYDAVALDDNGKITQVQPRDDRIFSESVIIHGKHITIATKNQYLFNLVYNEKKNCFEDQGDYSDYIDSPPLDLYKLDLQ